MKKSYEDRLRKARKSVDALDSVDGRKNREIGTIAAALEAGLRHPETNAQFEALVMLQDLMRKVGH